MEIDLQLTTFCQVVVRDASEALGREQVRGYSRGFCGFACGIGFHTYLPLQSATAGFLVKGRWRIVAAIYAFMLAAYFIHPYGIMLPLWAVLDCLLAFALVYPAAVLSKNLFRKEIEIKRFALAVLLISFISTVAHSLTMIFILVPVGMYKVEFVTFEAVYYAFVIGAAGSYIEDTIILVVSIVVYSPLLLFLWRSKIAPFPLS